MISAREGFTLIELLIVVAMIGILVPVGYSIMLDPVKSHAVESTRLHLQADYEKVHRMLDRDIRAAVRVVPAMGNLRSGTDSLILEIPVALENDLGIEILRVYYSVRSEGSGNAGLVLRRSVFKRTADKWQRQSSYPLSRTFSEIRFSGEEERWENAHWVKVDLAYRASSAHVDLAWDPVKIVALRGASS